MKNGRFFHFPRLFIGDQWKIIYFCNPVERMCEFMVLSSLFMVDYYTSKGYNSAIWKEFQDIDWRNFKSEGFSMLNTHYSIPIGDVAQAASQE